MVIRVLLSGGLDSAVCLAWALAQVRQEELVRLRAAGAAVLELTGDESEADGDKAWTDLTLLVWGPPCRHGVPEAKRCDDCDDELAEQASGWTDHDSYRADHGGTWGDA